jgi:RNA polymerase sigma factor (sigma-70 family)
MAYDRYAAALYGYSHWMLHDSTAAAGALKDTFVIAAATAGNLSEPSSLRPWLFALTRNECRRRIRPASAVRDGEADAAGEPADTTYELSDAADDLSDATVQFRAVGRPAAAADDLSDATVQFRAVGRPAAPADDLSDATIQFQVIRQLADPITPFRVIGQPTYPPGHVHGDQGQAELRSLIHSVLAGLRPDEREVIELSFRHDLNDSDLAIVLGVSQSRAHDLASRARGRLEEALGALHIALTGREACPVLGELLAGWDGQLTEQTRELVAGHIRECRTCAHHGWGAMRPAAFSRLLPLAPLPPELREQVLSVCTSTAEDAVAYRRRVVRRAESIWLARLSRAIRQVSWSSIRANPGMVVAAVAVALWVVAAVTATLLTLADSHAAAAQVTQATGSRAAPAQAAQAGVPTSTGSHAVATATAAASAARPSPTVTQSPVYVATQAVPSRIAATSPAPSRSVSSSARPSKSAKPSGSPSSSPSHTASPSPSSSTSSPAN